MKITSTYDHQNNLRIHTVTGDVYIDELLQEMEKIGSGPKDIAEMNSLWDLREANLALIKREHIERVKDIVVHYWKNSSSTKSALVVTRDIEFGLTRMYEMQVGNEVPTKIMTFRDYQKALDWMLHGTLDE